MIRFLFYHTCINYKMQPNSCTRTCATTRCAWVTPCPVRIEVVLPLKERCVCPEEKVLENCSRVVKVLSPASPGANLTERPS